MTRPDYIAIFKALDRIAEIMQEPAVTAMRGEAYTDCDTDRIQAGVEALQKLDPDPQTMVARLENEKLLAQAGKAVELGVVMLNRNGFQGVKGEAFTDRDQRIIEAGLAAFDRMTAYQRG